MSTLKEPARSLLVQLPNRDPKVTWRQRILEGAVKAANDQNLQWQVTERGDRYIYGESHRWFVKIRLYLDGNALRKCDVDNLLKHVMDGLQGQVGGDRRKIMHPPLRIIRNDRHVWRAEIEKVDRPDDISAEIGGELTISCL